MRMLSNEVGAGLEAEDDRRVGLGALGERAGIYGERARVRGERVPVRHLAPGSQLG